MYSTKTNKTIKIMKTQENEIVLDENFIIKADTYSWCLEHSYIKNVIDKKTGIEKSVDAIDKMWFPKLSDCLGQYVEQTSKTCTTLEELKNHLIQLNKTVERVAKIYCKNGKLIQL